VSSPTWHPAGRVHPDRLRTTSVTEFTRPTVTGIDDLTLLELAAVLGAAALGGALQSTLGFGASFTLVPTLAVLAPQLLPGSVIVAIVPMSLLMIARDRRGFDARAVGRVSVGRLPGIAVGAVVVALLPLRWLTASIAVVLLSAVLSMAAGWHVEVTRPREVVAGAISGLTGTAAALGGPPLALLYRGTTGPVMRPTLAGVWLAGTGPVLLALALAGSLTGHQALVGVWLGVAMVVGLVLAAPGVARLDDALLRRLVLAWAAVGGLFALARAVVGA
jgi:uncharacterized protein